MKMYNLPFNFHIKRLRKHLLFPILDTIFIIHHIFSIAAYRNIMFFKIIIDNGVHIAYMMNGLK